MPPQVLSQSALLSRSSNSNLGVLYSGGLDSAALVAYLLKRGFSVWPIYIESGLPWEPSEKAAAKKFLKAISSSKLHPLIELRMMLNDAYQNNWSQKGEIPDSRSPDKAVYLPARNLLLVTKALLYLQAININKLALATLKGNPFKDATPNYFSLLEKLLKKSFNRQLQILTPFQNKKKAHVIRLSKGYPVCLSTSCINPIKKAHCGICNKCAERKKAFVQAEVEDKTYYLN